MLPMELSRFRSYDVRTKRYSGWYAGKKMTRKLFSEISGIHVQTLKSWEKRGIKPRPVSLKKLRLLQLAVNADKQISFIDDKATKLAAAAAAKAEAAKAKALDRLLDAAMRAGRKPLSRKSKQQAIF